MAHKFNEVINEFLRIYGTETDFIRALIEKNAELDERNASDEEADAALQELMTAQFRRINRKSISGSRPGTEDTSVSSPLQIHSARTEKPMMESISGALSVALEALKEYFDTQAKKVRYTCSYETEDRIALKANFILDNTIKLPVKILLERLTETTTCTIVATLPLTVNSSLVYPTGKRLMEINATMREPIGSFCLANDPAADSDSEYTVYFKYTYITDGGFRISDFEKYLSSVCKSVLAYYDDILFCARGHFKASEARDIKNNIKRLEDALENAESGI